MIAFNELEYNDPDFFNNVLIVDGLNLAFRFKHTKTKDYAVQFFTTVKSLAKSYKCSRVFVLGDGGSKYRKSIDPKYKQSRVKLKEEQTAEEAKEFEEFLEEFNKALELCSTCYQTLKYSGVEADDIAAYITKKVSEDYDDIWLISTDRDWDLLIDKHISRFAYTTRKEVTFKNWSDHYDYDPEDHISIKVLMGDKGDDVPGVAGVGEKRAYNIIRSYGPTAFDVYEALPLPGNQVFVKNLNNFGDQLLLNYKLMDLLTYCEEALCNHKDEINEKVENYLK